MSGTRVVDSELPIVAAPMAGGPSTVALATAVHAAGGFPFLAAGYKSAEALADEVQQARGIGGAFGVNLFVPGSMPVDEEAFRAYAAELEPEAARLGVELDPRPVTNDDDEWAAKVAFLTAEPVPVVSLTFGLPAARDISALRRAGSRVLATVTTAAEARAAVEAGVDGLVVQAPAAGGHSGTFDPHRAIRTVDPADLVREVRAAVALPIVAGGGVTDTRTVGELLQAGAEAVAVGTLLLRTDESGASQTHKDALADPAFTQTVITHAFTGRPARGLRNGFIDRHEATAPFGYPAIHHLTRPMRQAAARRGDAERLHLWAGTGFRAAGAVVGPAGEVVRELARGL
ncbi:NAD(P)H-dependent flavin oxidoreductase [Catenulispora subtropica]|uniref:Propionate 3-nitronate monooxygenase n=1 Tax=Catenulispora subtropica TaxID=450798 RepID=A0ABN2S6E8_9ACTN